ncbi:hypothetical protein CYMTET_22731 [Cymbomonas tetramitiformis]|uniref:Uncharacterized protein n=1 Tax=Cymbomonas tetramitiformis TaxID=36881 RepID=A0AAE0FZC1_9CHLO|nr:hypothetical protein CYMTET_22731 [Cymbomonas tetramitiformis]
MDSLDSGSTLIRCVQCAKLLSKSQCSENERALFDFLRNSLSASVVTRQTTLQQLQRTTSALNLLETAAKELVKERKKTAELAQAMQQMANMVHARASVLFDTSDSGSQPTNARTWRLEELPPTTAYAQLQMVLEVMDELSRQRSSAVTEARDAEAEIGRLREEVEHVDEAQRRLSNAARASIKGAEREALRVTQESQRSTEACREEAAAAAKLASEREKALEAELAELQSSLQQSQSTNIHLTEQAAAERTEMEIKVKEGRATWTAAKAHLDLEIEAVAREGNKQAQAASEDRKARDESVEALEAARCVAERLETVVLAERGELADSQRHVEAVHYELYGTAQRLRREEEAVAHLRQHLHGAAVELELLRDVKGFHGATREAALGEELARVRADLLQARTELKEEVWAALSQQKTLTFQAGDLRNAAAHWESEALHLEEQNLQLTKSFSKAVQLQAALEDPLEMHVPSLDVTSHPPETHQYPNQIGGFPIRPDASSWSESGMQSLAVQSMWTPEPNQEEHKGDAGASNDIPKFVKFI